MQKIESNLQINFRKVSPFGIFVLTNFHFKVDVI